MSAVPATPLHLSTRRGPTGVASELCEVTRLPFSIGRAPDNDWTLPDPGRVLSKHHCRITANGETWLITDTSSNGTFLNGASLDPAVPQALRNGDRVVFGIYEIEALLGEEAQPEGDDARSRMISVVEGEARDEDLHGDGPRDERLRDGDVAEDRLTSDPFSPLDSGVLDAARPSVGLPTDFDPLRPAEGVTESPYAVPDHVPELETNFRAPRPSLELLPEDWNQAPEPRPASQVAAGQTNAPPPLEGEEWGEGWVEGSHRSTPPPNLGPLRGPSPQGEGEHSSSAPPVPPPPAAVAVGDAAGFAAFVAGAGMAGASVADPGTTLAALGAAFRIVVSGLRRIMIARATIKGEFRIEQTMIRAAGNNPLKFSADDDDALAALLGTGRQGGMRPSQAVGEALRDMRRHELAVAAAMQQAVRDVLSELDPEQIMREQSSGMLHRLSGWSERGAWRRYAARHARMMRALANDFDSVFGRSFGRAYEAALAELAAQDVEADPP